MIWWIENPARSASERLAVENLAGSQSWLQIVKFRLDGTRVCWDIDIVTSRRSYPISLRYPDFFPGSPPLVFPRGIKERWSFHQYGAGGELCLEIGPDNWDEVYTGADMLESAHRLLTGEEEHASGGSDLDSRHKESLGQLMRIHKNRIFISTEAHGLMAELLDFEVLSATVAVTYRKGSRTFVVTSIGEGDTDWKAPLPPVLLSSTFSLTTTILRWPTGIALPNSNDVASFRTEFQSLGIDLSKCECLIVIQGIDILAFDLVLSAGVGSLAAVLEPASSPRLDKDHSGLATRKVAIVGCGSMGSKVATTLARSGVGEFILVDDDILLPENFVRNDLDWREVALHKVDALADKLEYVQPSIRCKRYRRSLGGQESSANIENLIEVLANCDLIVDATADVGCFSYLGSLAKMAKRPMIWGEVFAGGFGGFIARHRPAVDPVPMAMRHMMMQWCETQGQSFPSPAGRYESGDENPAIADDAEVGVIASHMALLSLDTLLPRNPTGYPYGIYVIGLRSGWIFDQPFEVRPIDVGPAGSQPEAQPTIEEKKPRLKRYLNCYRMTLMQILLPINIVEMIASELKREGKRETGGLLFAEHIGGTTFTIVEATVQKNSGTPVEFVRDPAQHQAQLEAFFARTGDECTRFNYFGEWHSHPTFEPVPSGQDLRTMRAILEDPETGVSFLVLMICRLTSERGLSLSATVCEGNGAYHPASVFIQVPPGSVTRRRFRAL